MSTANNSQMGRHLNLYQVHLLLRSKRLMPLLTTGDTRLESSVILLGGHLEDPYPIQIPRILRSNWWIIVSFRHQMDDTKSVE